MQTSKPLYHRHRFPDAVISRAVRWYFRFQLSLRDIEELLFERGVVVNGGALGFADRPTTLRPPVDAPFVPGTTTEIHPQAEAFVATLAGVLQRGLALFIDYGFPEAEYYLPQRHGGTLMCHQAHRADGNPLAWTAGISRSLGQSPGLWRRW